MPQYLTEWFWWLFENKVMDDYLNPLFENVVPPYDQVVYSGINSEWSQSRLPFSTGLCPQELYEQHINYVTLNRSSYLACAFRYLCHNSRISRVQP